MLSDLEIVELTKLNLWGIDNAMMAVYGSRESLPVITHLINELGDYNAHGICEIIHKLYVHTPDDHKITDTPIWDVITMLGVTCWADTSDLSELIKAGNTVTVGSEPVGDSDGDDGA